LRDTVIVHEVGDAFVTVAELDLSMKTINGRNDGTIEQS